MFGEDTIAHEPPGEPELSDSDELAGALDSVITYVVLQTTILDCYSTRFHGQL